MAPPTRAELLSVARVPRAIGFALVIAGTALLFAPLFDYRLWHIGPVPTRDAGWLLLVAGWTLFGYVIGRRTTYNIARRAEEAADGEPLP